MALENSYITLDYFKRQMIALTDIGNAVKDSDYEALVTESESVFLTRLLGYEFYKLLKDNTNFGNSPIDGTSAIYTNLIQGFEFTNSVGDLTITEGLTGAIIDVTGGFKRSPIANFCYWGKSVPTNITQSTGLGEMLNVTENSVAVSSLPKAVRAWNEMVDALWVFHDYLVLNKSDYPTYIGLKYKPVSEPTWNQKLAPNQELFVKHNVWGL
jgi:hypothetical protein